MNDWTRLTSEAIEGRQAAVFVCAVLALFRGVSPEGDDRADIDETIATALAHAGR
jgi:hypothetical protein